MNSTDIIERLIDVTHPQSPTDTRQAYREALQALVRLRCAEIILAMTLDQLQVHVAMSDEFND